MAVLHFLNDMRHSARTLRRTPGATVIAIIALAFGIGLTTLMFSIIYGAMIRGLPFDEPEELVVINQAKPSAGFNNIGVTVHDFADWREQQRSFEDLGAYYQSSLNLASEGAPPDRISTAVMNTSVFALTGVAPILGRVYGSEDEAVGAPRVIVIGWGVWQRRFGGDPGIIGRTVRTDGMPTTIIGVMPRGYGFPSEQEAWLPLRIDLAQTQRGEGIRVRVFARLRDGFSIDQANADMLTIAKRLELEYPATNEGLRPRVVGFTEEFIGREERSVLYTMMGAVLFVLLIACANVTNLLIGRATLRTKEVGVRTALGASRWRVASPFLAESFVLAIAGGVLGTLIAAWGIRAFDSAVAATSPPFWLDFALHGPVLLCTMAATLLASLAAGAIPALQAARANTQDILKDESRGSSSFRLGRLSRLLVAAEMALSVGLLVGAGLMIRTVVNVNRLDIGFDAAHIFTARMSLRDSAYATPQQRAAFAEQLTTRLEGIAGLERVALASAAPGGGSGRATFDIEGSTHLSETDYRSASTVIVSPGFFETLPVEVAGREFIAQDRRGSLPVAIVNRSFQRRYFPQGDAIGKRIRFGGANSTEDWLTIVGIVPDLYADGLDNDVPEAIYRATTQYPLGTITVIARTRTDPLASMPDVRRAVEGIDPDLPLFEAGSLKKVLEDDNWHYGVFGSLFIAFGAAALFLASIGLYGVMSFSVSTRRREIGVRMAVGAHAGNVMRMVLGQGLAQTAVGLAVGTVFALGVSQLIAALLFDVQPRDPVVFAGILTVLLVTSVLACWIPARRAAGVDPLEAMRAE